MFHNPLTECCDIIYKYIMQCTNIEWDGAGERSMKSEIFGRPTTLRGHLVLYDDGNNVYT
jgi:hypothetical protein